MASVSQREGAGPDSDPADVPAGRASGALPVHGPGVVAEPRLDRRVRLVEADPLVRTAARRAAARLAEDLGRPLQVVGVHGLDRVASCPLLAAKRTRNDPTSQSSTARVHTVCYTVRDVLAAELHMAHGCADSFAVLLPGEDGDDVLKTLVWPSRVDALGLTVREVDVLALALERLTDEEIAERLVVSRTTVRSHLRALRQKLGVHDRRSLRRALLGAERQHPHMFGQEPLLAAAGWREG